MGSVIHSSFPNDVDILLLINDSTKEEIEYSSRTIAKVKEHFVQRFRLTLHETICYKSEIKAFYSFRCEVLANSMLITLNFPETK